VWIALSVVLMLFKKHRKLGFSILVCIAAAWLVNDGVIKNLVCRTRPFDTVPGLEVLVSKPSSFSFPSGHACSSFCAAFVITRMRGKKGALVYIPAALIALSRIYVGVHYPSDILVGAIIGTVSGAVFTWIIIHRLDRPVSRLLKTPEGN
jgi:undecaprenyl-diphosphatase